MHALHKYSLWFIILNVVIYKLTFDYCLNIDKVQI